MKTNPKSTKAQRQHLRTDATSAEVYFWEFLKSRRFRNFKFRRQQGFGNFIVDFYCAELRLVIELDGGIHQNQMEYDQDRQSFLLNEGLHVIRFTNEEVIQRVDSVLDQLSQAIDQIQPPQPLLAKEGQKPK